MEVSYAHYEKLYEESLERIGDYLKNFACVENTVLVDLTSIHNIVEETMTIFRRIAVIMNQTNLTEEQKRTLWEHVRMTSECRTRAIVLIETIRKEGMPCDTGRIISINLLTGSVQEFSKNRDGTLAFAFYALKKPELRGPFPVYSSPA